MVRKVRSYDHFYTIVAFWFTSQGKIHDNVTVKVNHFVIMVYTLLGELNGVLN